MSRRRGVGDYSDRSMNLKKCVSCHGPAVRTSIIVAVPTHFLSPPLAPNTLIIESTNCRRGFARIILERVAGIQ